MAVHDLTARNAIEGRLWVRIYIFIFMYFLFIFFCIEFFEGVSRGGPYRWSMDRSVRWSVDPVRWTGPRTGGQCFRVTPVECDIHTTRVGREVFRHVTTSSRIQCKPRHRTGSGHNSYRYRPALWRKGLGTFKSE